MIQQLSYLILGIGAFTAVVSLGILAVTDITESCCKYKRNHYEKDAKQYI